MTVEVTAQTTEELTAKAERYLAMAILATDEDPNSVKARLATRQFDITADELVRRLLNKAV